MLLLFVSSITSYLLNNLILQVIYKYTRLVQLSLLLYRYAYTTSKQGSAIIGMYSWLAINLSGCGGDNVCHRRRLDPTMELITYSFVLYLQHGRHDVKCKPSIRMLKPRKRNRRKDRNHLKGNYHNQRNE